MLAREPVVPWRTLRPYYIHELEPGRSPEIDPKPWLDPRQMKLAAKVMANEMRRHNAGYKLDLVGQRFGRLMVLKYGGARKWTCRCRCGRVKDISRSSLRSGHSPTRSCGCLAKEVRARSARLNQPKAVAAILRKSARKAELKKTMRRAA